MKELPPFIVAPSGQEIAIVDHLTATLEAVEVPEQEKGEVLAFTESLKPEIVEVP